MSKFERTLESPTGISYILLPRHTPPLSNSFQPDSPGGRGSFRPRYQVMLSLGLTEQFSPPREPPAGRPHTSTFQPIACPTAVLTSSVFSCRFTKYAPQTLSRAGQFLSCTMCNFPWIAFFSSLSVMWASSMRMWVTAIHFHRFIISYHMHMPWFIRSVSEYMLCFWCFAITNYFAINILVVVSWRS